MAGCKRNFFIALAAFGKQSATEAIPLYFSDEFYWRLTRYTVPCDGLNGIMQLLKANDATTSKVCSTGLSKWQF